MVDDDEYTCGMAGYARCLLVCAFDGENLVLCLDGQYLCRALLLIRATQQSGEADIPAQAET